MAKEEGPLKTQELLEHSLKAVAAVLDWHRFPMGEFHSATVKICRAPLPCDGTKSNK